jgi:hypothetical protein
LVSTLAPTSSTSVNPLWLGITAASAGRSTPSMVPITILAAIITAPVLPAENMPWARPSRTRLAQMRIDERGFLRIGVTGDSSIPTTSSAWTISRRPSGGAGQRSSSRRTFASSPTRRIEHGDSRSAASTPSTTDAGA